jgi:hypothetical protein
MFQGLDFKYKLKLGARSRFIKTTSALVQDSLDYLDFWFIFQKENTVSRVHGLVDRYSG